MSLKADRAYFSAMPESRLGPLVPPDVPSIDAPCVYAIALGGSFCICILLRCRGSLASIWERVGRTSSRYLVHLTLVRRHRFFRPLNSASVLVTSIYIALNTLCIAFKVQSAAEAAARAGTLSLINLLFLFGGFHLGFLADCMGISLEACQSIHRLTGSISFLLACSHALIMLQRQPFPLNVSENLFGLLAVVSLCLLVVIFNRFLRPLLYELFLRFHQALAMFCAYTIYVHIPPSSFSRTYLYAIAAISLLVFTAELGLIIHRNGVFHHKMPRARISQTNGIVYVSLHLTQPVVTQPGQYINLWIPAAGVRAFFQTHPFMVHSWIDGKTRTIDLLVVPRKGFTRDLLRLASAEMAGPSAHVAMFSGPHGHGTPVQNYETVLMFASDSGIAAQLPFLKQLVLYHNSHQARTRRVHLVWLVRRTTIGVAASHLIQQALEKDTLSYILTVSIYHDSIQTPQFSFGDHAVAYKGEPDIKSIVRKEVNTAHSEGTRLVVTVSGSGFLRDELRDCFRNTCGRRIKLVELEYQPLSD